MQWHRYCLIWEFQMTQNLHNPTKSWLFVQWYCNFFYGGFKQLSIFVNIIIWNQHVFCFMRAPSDWELLSTAFFEINMYFVSKRCGKGTHFIRKSHKRKLWRIPLPMTHAACVVQQRRRNGWRCSCQQLMGQNWVHRNGEMPSSCDIT